MPRLIYFDGGYCCVKVTMTKEGLYPRIYALVSLVPSGSVTTYGDLARQAGCTARTVGFAMAALPSGHDIPWQRVINSQGKISPRSDGDGLQVQKVLLEAEGVLFDAHQRVDLDKYRWEFPVID